MDGVFREENLISKISLVEKDRAVVDEHIYKNYSAVFWYKTAEKPILIRIDFTRVGDSAGYYFVRIFVVEETGSFFWKRRRETEQFVGMDETKKNILLKVIEVYQREQKEMLQ